MRLILFILILGTSLRTGATEVLPGAAFADLVLSASRTAPRALGVESAADARDMFIKASTENTWRANTATDVRRRQKIEPGILTFNQDGDQLLRSGTTFVAREFRGETEIRAALDAIHARLNGFGNEVVRALNQRFPPMRAAEALRLGLWTAATNLLELAGTESPELTVARAPLVIAGVMANDRRRQAQREKAWGVPALKAHLALVEHALQSSRADRRQSLTRVFSILSGRARVTPEVHQSLFHRGDRAMTPAEFGRLIESGRPMVARWSDGATPDDQSIEVTAEMVLFSRADVADPALHWAFSYRAVPLRSPHTGTPVHVRCAAGLAGN